ncbi:MAG TPA: antibiotic biosynthesis monooxygenase [Rhizomicrobium sp.]|nr:antibiotic biosynthesis monooxygenase [Rhizomicrobium sp.]
MIVRIWTGVALEHNAEMYRRHFEETVAPRLRETRGFLGYTVLERQERGRIEFMVITRWETMDAIRAFAGIMPDKAVVEEAVRPFLEKFEEYVTHYIIAMHEDMR